MKLRTVKSEIKVPYGGGLFYGVPLDPGETEELRQKHTTYTRAAGQVFPETDFTDLKIETIQRTISRWEELEDEDGNKIPCNDDTKRAFFLLNPTVANAVMDKFTKAGRGPDITIKPTEDDILGNLPDG